MASAVGRLPPKDLVHSADLRETRKWLGLSQASYLRQASNTNVSHPLAQRLYSTTSIGSDLNPFSSQSPHDLPNDHFRTVEAQKRKSALAQLPRRGIREDVLRAAYEYALENQKMIMQHMIQKTGDFQVKRSAWSMSLSALPLPIHSRDELSLRLRPDAREKLSWTIYCRRSFFGKPKVRKGWFARLSRSQSQKGAVSLPSSNENVVQAFTLPHCQLGIAYTEVLHPDIGVFSGKV